MMLRLFLLLLFLVSSKVDVLACLLSEQLLKMQEEELGQITYFLKNENWSLGNSERNVRYPIDNHFVNRDLVSWSGNYSESVTIYVREGKSNIVIYRTQESCFNELIHNFKKSNPAKNEIIGQGLYTKFKVGNKAVWFIETPGTYGYNTFEVLVYNIPDIQLEVKQAKQRAAVYSEKLKQAETQFSQSDFTGSELSYSELMAIQRIDGGLLYDCLSEDEINNRRAACRLEICRKIVNTAEGLVERGLNEEALTEFTEASDCLRGDNVYSYAGQDLAKVEQRIRDLKLAMRLAEAKQLEQEGKLEEALTAYEDAVRISGNNINIIESKNKLQAKITDTKTQSLLNEASVLLGSKEFDSAIKKYDQALILNRGDKRILGLKEDAEKQWKAFRSERYMTAADRNYSERKYREAIDNYKAYLELNPKDKYAIERISSATHIVEILEKRSSTVFSYAETNAADYKVFRDELSNKLNATVDTQDKGSFRFETNIEFDTAGVNRSKPTIAASTNNLFNDALFSLHRATFLQAPMEAGYFLAAKENDTYDLSWTTEKIVLHSKRWGIFSTTEKPNAQLDECIAFIRSAPYHNGVSRFTVTKKQFNGKTFRDIKFEDYQPRGTMPAACTSIILPGLGSVLTGEQERGYMAMTGFFASAGLAYLSEKKSKTAYDDYRIATDQEEIDRLYKTANRWHHRSLAFATVAIGVYIYDIYGAFSNGRQNALKSRALKERAKREYVRRERLTL